jgi:hypothetical protein
LLSVRREKRYAPRIENHPSAHPRVNCAAGRDDKSVPQRAAARASDPRVPRCEEFYFFEPCDDVLFARVLEKIRDSLRDHPRPLHLIYMAPGRKEALLDTADFLVKQGQNAEFKCCWYKGGVGTNHLRITWLGQGH